MRSPHELITSSSVHLRILCGLGRAIPLLTVLAFVSPKLVLAQGRTYVGPHVHPHDFKGDLSKLPKAHPSNLPAPSKATIPGSPVAPPRPPGPPDPLWQKRIPGRSSPDPAETAVPSLETLRQESIDGSSPSVLVGVTPTQFTNPSPNFDTGQPGDGPPDDNGAVGPNHYIAHVNFSFQIFDKQGNSLAGPTNPTVFWASAPMTDQCRNLNRGDPYTNYDHLADRWVISFFSNENLADPGNAPGLKVQCIAVSKGPNPVTDGFFAYTFHLGYKNDYPKIAVWPDGYYMISQRGYDGGAAALDAVVFDRANMLNGNPATFQHPATEFTSGRDVIAMPTDLTGPPPPAGSPNFYVRPYDGTLYGDGVPRIQIFEFHTDWGVPANSTFLFKQDLVTATFRSDICNGANLDQDCVPQPGTGTKLDTSGSIWQGGPMQYRNFGGHETIVFSHVVNVDGAGLAGVRWYELRRTPPGSGSWVIQQQGTFAPADSTTTSTTSIYRWTPSIAMDKAGNIALGHNVSNDGVAPHPTVFPGIRMVGRLAGDPPGEMTTPEVHVVDGGGANGGNRWGDYSAMRVDPADGCTFWYTTEYVAASGQQTRVAAARFPTCNPANLAIFKSDSPDPVIAGNQLNYTILVVNNGPDNATNVVVTDTLPTGVIFLSSSIPCTGGGSVKTCAIGNLANGASTSFTIQVRVPANFLSSMSVTTKNITNTATVAADQLDPDTSDNTATATTNVIEQADVRITKTCKPDSPAPVSSPAFCDIVVTNLGVSDAQNVVVTDTLTSNSPFTLGTLPLGCTAVPPSGSATSFTVTCNVGTLAAGASVTLHIPVTSGNVGGDVNDVAKVSSSTPDPNTSNNQDTGHVSFFSVADLSITKTSSPNPVVAGTNLTYTINVSNAGPSPAINVVATDTLPAQVSVVSVTPSVGTCSGGIPGNPAQPVICTLGTIASGGSAMITVVVTVSPSTPNGTILINNGAVKSDTFDGNNNNNVVTANSPVVARADLAITKTSDKTNYKPNALITFTVRVTNNGPSDALAVIVTDNLPTTVQALYVSDTGGCTKSGLTLTCNLGNMPVGTSKSFNVLETVKGNRGTITNNVSVASSTTDPVPANNTTSLSVGVK